MSLPRLTEEQVFGAPPAWRSESQGFIDAAARLAGAVAIVAGQDGAGPFGLVVSSLTILSVEPPRLLFCVRKAASCHARMLAADTLSLTVLGTEDETEAQIFAGRDAGEERFAPERWTVTDHRPPHFRTGLLSVEGEVFQRISAASHTLFILNAAESRVLEAEPLLYYNRSFRRLAAFDPDARS